MRVLLLKTLMEPLPVKKFNEMQTTAYSEYCAKCKANGVTPEPQSTYFPTIPVKYGYATVNSSGETITWKRRKRDFY